MVGKRGGGKRSMINNIIGEDLLKLDFSFSCESTKPHVCRTLLINHKLYHCIITHITEYVSLPHNRNTDKNERMYSNQRMKLNLIIHVVKNGRLTDGECEQFRWFREFSKAAHNISALVITGCEGLDDLGRTRIVEDWKSEELVKDFAAIMGKGIYTVGFPNLDACSDLLKKMLKPSMQEDVIKLHQLIEESNDLVEIPKGINVPECSII